MVEKLSLIIVNIYLLVRQTLILAPVVWLGWNFGVTQFVPVAPHIALFDAIVLIFSVQTLLVYLLRPVHKEYIAVYYPLYLDRPENLPDDSFAPVKNEN